MTLINANNTPAATSKQRWPLDDIRGDTFADEVLRRERAKLTKTFLTPQAQARWMHSVLGAALAAVLRDIHGGAWAHDPDTAAIRKCALQARMDTLVTQYPGCAR